MIAAVSPRGSIRFLDSNLTLELERQEDKIIFVIKTLTGNVLCKIYIGSIVPEEKEEEETE